MDFKRIYNDFFYKTEMPIELSQWALNIETE